MSDVNISKVHGIKKIATMTVSKDAADDARALIADPNDDRSLRQRSSCSNSNADGPQRSSMTSAAKTHWSNNKNDGETLPPKEVSKAKQAAKFMVNCCLIAFYVTFSGFSAPLSGASRQYAKVDEVPPANAILLIQTFTFFIGCSSFCFFKYGPTWS